MDKDTKLALIKKAFEAKDMAYAPYSDFHVGAALLSADGTIYTGCNIENAAYSPTICAERTAFSKAVSEGAKEFTAIAVVGGKNGGESVFAYPCGVCRQVMTEFCDPKEFRVIVAVSEHAYNVHTLGELLPQAFGP